MPWDVGWGMSEPHFGIDAQRLRDDGAWIRIDVHGRPRPRFLEPDWRRRIRSLEPKGRMELSASRALTAPSVALDAPLRVRFRARYAYRAIPRLPDRGTKILYPDALGKMSDIPPFTLTSDWIEVDLLP